MYKQYKVLNKLSTTNYKHTKKGGRKTNAEREFELALIQIQRAKIDIEEAQTHLANLHYLLTQHGTEEKPQPEKKIPKENQKTEPAPIKTIPKESEEITQEEEGEEYNPEISEAEYKALEEKARAKNRKVPKPEGKYDDVFSEP